MDAPVPVTPDVLDVLPAPSKIRHKGDAGRILVIGGCPSYTGAPHLAALAALRTGCGLVTAAAAAELIPRILGALPDIMALPLPGGWDIPCVGPAAKSAKGCDAVALGPGLGRGEGQDRFVAAFLATSGRPPCVIDADALHALRDADMPALLTPKDILTPHPGEAAKLLGTTAASVQADRQGALRALTDLAPCVWVLKGAGTLIGQSGEGRRIIGYDEPNLAVGGSGDVLTGCAAACLAQGAPSLQAAQAAALMHAHAGRLLKDAYPFRGNLAEEIAGMLPRARAALAGAPR